MNVKFRVDRSRLVDGLATLAKAAPTGRGKSRRPVLNSARLTVDAGGLTLAATDLDVAAAVRLESFDMPELPPFAVDYSIDRIVDLSQFSRLSRETARTPTIAIEFPQAGGVRVDGLATLATEPAAAFPDSPELAAADERWAAVAGWVGNAAELAAAISAVEFATDDSSSRYALGGVRLEFIGGEPMNAAELIAVATDGRRIAIARVGAGLEFSSEPGGKLSPALRNEPAAAGFILPAKAAAAFVYSLSRKAARSSVAILEIIEKEITRVHVEPPAAQDEPAREPVRIVERRIRLTIAERSGNVAAVFSSREIDGRFPSWRDIANGARGRSGTIAADNTLIDSLKTAIGLSCDDNRAVRLIVRDRGGVAIYRDKSRGIKFGGRFNAAPQAVAGWGGVRESRDILIDPRLLIEWLRACQPAAAQAGGFEFNQPKKDSAVYFQADRFGAFSFVIMPLYREKRKKAAAAA
jgi:DNA polymerase III sliding clamp (beta) subunit (PCNA family)